MPELPEVETTCRGIAPHVTGQTVLELILRTKKLRHPLDTELCRVLAGRTIVAVERRAKYLLLHCDRGSIIIHLGMSGMLRVVPADTTEQKHDHVDLIFTNGQALRFTDPRKFGIFTYTDEDPATHRFLVNLGPEPLSAAFTAAYLHERARGKKQAIKPFIMDQAVVVGVGNIYANEALFRAGIHPTRQAGRVSIARLETLVEMIRIILNEAIAAGGTTISDFHQADGKPGYFARQLQVYGRAGEPCVTCGAGVKSCRLGQRSTYYCSHCQR
ncbi:MAG: DNA-formamidopyrimidine glycosylase [Desulfuromonas sp.]|nr:MAG: DNA-formamidopyrimidine glycosylase [Desulfuromonas sp.]